MPYIKQAARQELDAGGKIRSSGDLNYVITKACLSTLGGALSYQDINAIIGALECVKLEFYRRMAVDYEDHKKRENGDVYV